MKLKQLLNNIKRKKAHLLREKGIKRKRYDRDAAKSYAEHYAEIGNNKEYPLFKDNDCTNFVSQVLHAGGMNMEGNIYNEQDNWFCRTTNSSNLYDVSLTWRSAKYFRKYWGNDNGVGCNKANKFITITVLEALNNFENIFEILDIGDVIQYGDPKNNNYPYHSQVIHAKEYNPVLNINDLFVAQHSVNKKHVSFYDYLKLLQDKDKRYIYLYHFD